MAFLADGHPRECQREEYARCTCSLAHNLTSTLDRCEEKEGFISAIDESDLSLSLFLSLSLSRSRLRRCAHKRPSRDNASRV